MSALIPVPDVLSRVLALISPVGREVVGLTGAVQRVLAEPVMARRSQPPFPASAMDGYAVRAAEVQPGTSFRVVGESAAGRPFDGQVGPGEAFKAHLIRAVRSDQCGNHLLAFQGHAHGVGTIDQQTGSVRVGLGEVTGGVAGA